VRFPETGCAKKKTAGPGRRRGPPSLFHCTLREEEESAVFPGSGRRRSPVWDGGTLREEEEGAA